MPINLSHEPESSGYRTINRNKFTDWGLVISVVILLLSASIFVYVKYTNQKSDAKKAEIESEISMASKSLEGEAVDEVADFMQRLSIVASSVSTRKNPNDLIQELGKSMVIGSYVKDIKYSNTLVVTYVTDNYLTAAKQILSLKKSTYFSKGANLSKIYRNEDGKVLIDMEIII